MKKKLTHNLGLKVASLLLACVLWFLVAQIGNPRDTKTFSNIPVKLINTELLVGENKYYEVLDKTDTVRVTVSAPRSIIQTLRSTDIVAEADVSKLTDINTIAISYNVLNAEVDSISGDHDTVRLSVEEKASKWVRINYATTGKVAENYMIANASPDQTMIEVSGPKSVVDRISHAYVEMDVEGATTNISANVEFALFDREEKKIDQSKLEMNVNQVHMSVEILATKSVPVELNFSGEPKEGYLLTGEQSSNPSAVLIAGTPYALSGINKVTIPASDVDVEGADKNVTVVLSLEDYLPENIRLADRSTNGKVSVTVFVEPIVERILEIPINNVAVRNTSKDYDVNISHGEESLKLTVAGLSKYVDSLEGSSVYGYVDVASWMSDNGMEELKPGTYQVPVKFILNGEIEEPEPVMITVLVEHKTLEE